MSERALYLVVSDLSGIIRKEAAFGDLDRVQVLADVKGEEVIVPEGSTGTIVAIWGKGTAFEVEFTQPVDTLATVAPDLVRLIRRATPPDRPSRILNPAR